MYLVVNLTLETIPHTDLIHTLKEAEEYKQLLEAVRPIDEHYTYAIMVPQLM